MGRGDRVLPITIRALSSAPAKATTKSRNMKKFLAAALTAFAALTAQASIVVTFTPQSQHAQVGNVVSVDMFISGLGSQILSGFDLSFVFDPTILSFVTADGASAVQQLGDGIGLTPVLVFDSLINGSIGAQGYALADDAALAASQADDFLLFHFDLVATVDGVTSFSLGLDPTFERNLVGLDFLTLSDVNVQAACIAVGSGSCDAPVSLPEPATLALLPLAGLGLAATRRRRQR